MIEGVPVKCSQRFHVFSKSKHENRIQRQRTTITIIHDYVCRFFLISDEILHGRQWSKSSHLLLHRNTSQNHFNRGRRKIYKTFKASWLLKLYSLHEDQESQGTDNRDFTWQTRHSSFSKFLAFMILLKCPIRWTSNYPSLNSRWTNRKAVNVWSQWSMMDWLGYLMTIKLRIWEQFPCGRGFFRANHLPTHHHHKHIRQHPGLSLVETDHVTWKLASHWTRLGPDLDLELFDKLGSGGRRPYVPLQP